MGPLHERFKRGCMKYCSQASGYYLRAVVSQMALDGGRTALASELPRQKRAAIPQRGWAPDRLSCSKTWLTKRSVDILVAQGSAWLEVTRQSAGPRLLAARGSACRALRLFSQQVIYSLCGTRTWKAAHPRFTVQPNRNGN